MFIRISDSELKEIRTSISDIHTLLRETREQYMTEMGAIRANQDICMDNQRHLEQMKNDFGELRNTVRDNANWIKEQEAIKKNRDDILRQNYYATAFKLGTATIFFILSLATLGLLFRLNGYIGQQLKQEKIEQPIIEKSK